MKTFTPQLDPAVLERLRAYATHFAPDFPQSKPARWAGVYLHGLLADGERQSLEPPSRRVPLPPNLTSKNPEQALQQFVNHPPCRRRGMTSRRWVLAPNAPEPVSVEAVAKGLKLRRVSWRNGTKGKLSAWFGW